MSVEGIKICKVCNRSDHDEIISTTKKALRGKGSQQINNKTKTISGEKKNNSSSFSLTAKLCKYYTNIHYGKTIQVPARKPKCSRKLPTNTFNARSFNRISVCIKLGARHSCWRHRWLGLHTLGFLSSNGRQNKLKLQHMEWYQRVFSAWCIHIMSIQLHIVHRA